MEGIDEKLKLWDQKSGQKYLQKSQKWKILQHKIGDDLTQKHSYIDANQEFTRCGNWHNILPLFGGLEGSLTFSPLLSSLTPWSTPTPLKKQLWLGGGRGMDECLPLYQPLGSYL
jgi:hypothetical protein